MYKQPSAAGTGWWTGEPSSLASSHGQQPFKLISKQFGLTTLHTMEVFKLAGFFTTANRKDSIENLNSICNCYSFLLHCNRLG